MQRRSTGSKRFRVGDAAPRPTRADIYQAEHAPHDRTAYNDLHTQLAVPPRTSQLHPLALRHGLIASQLGLPMQPRSAADSGWYDDDEAWSDQTTRYDEWELQKELVTYEQTDPGYHERSALDIQPAPLAPIHYEQRHAQQLSAAEATARPHGVPPCAHDPARHHPSKAAPASPRARAAALPMPAAHYLSDEPVSYPHDRSWLKRALVLMALLSSGYAAYHYNGDRHDPAPTGTLPTPPLPASAVAAPEAPEPTPEATTPSSPDLAPQPPMSAKERRSAARAALIAERWRERRTARRSSASRSGEDESARDDVAQGGVLRINSRPWSQVHVDGQHVGHTPQMNLQLSAGTHRVTLINPELQLSKTLAVHIAAGDIATHTVNLDQSGRQFGRAPTPPASRRASRARQPAASR